MNLRGTLRRGAAISCCVALTTAGCGFKGLNSLPLPGTEGRGPGAITYHVEVANIGTLEPNSPVLLDDVVVGSVRRLSVVGWHADVEVSVRPDVVVPDNAAVSVGQTSLLGSMHLALDPPLGGAPRGHLAPGATIPLTDATTYPSTERTLSTLSAVVNAGGLGQIGEVIHNFNIALSGHRSEARELLSQLNEFVAVFDDQQSDVIGSIQALDRMASALAAQQSVLTRALDEIPPALDVLIAQRPRFTTALDRMRAFSGTTLGLINDSRNDLVATIQNLDPTIRALADVGPEIDTALAFLPVMPFGQNLIDRGVKGDYMNLFAVFDLTVPRLKRTLASGTRWGNEHTHLVPAPGDPGYDSYYTTNPLGVPLDPPPPQPAATDQPPPTPSAPTGGA